MARFKIGEGFTNFFERFVERDEASGDCFCLTIELQGIIIYFNVLIDLLLSSCKYLRSANRSYNKTPSYSRLFFCCGHETLYILFIYFLYIFFYDQVYDQHYQG